MDNEQFALANERDFLLRSLRDLDDERDAGNIDEEQYATLHGDYTARCAAVLRSISESESGSRRITRSQGDSTQDASSRRLRLVVWIGVVAFAVVTAVSLSFTMGARLPGQFVTGPAPKGVAGGASLAALEAAVKENPEDIEAHRSLARAYLSEQRYADGLKEFDEVVRIAPDDTEAHDVAVALTEHDALAAHAHDELGITPHSTAKPMQAALASALTFTASSEISPSSNCTL